MTLTHIHKGQYNMADSEFSSGTSKGVQPFDNTEAKRYVEHIGMIWDEHFAKRTEAIAHEYGITQEQWDIMVREYAWRTKTLLSPSYYTTLQRILIALRFLNPFAKGD